MTKIYIDYNNNDISTNLKAAISVIEGVNTSIKAPYGFNNNSIFSNILRDVKIIKSDLKNSLAWINNSKNDYANFDNKLKSNVSRIPRYRLSKKNSKVK